MLAVARSIDQFKPNPYTNLQKNPHTIPFGICTHFPNEWGSKKNCTLRLSLRSLKLRIKEDPNEKYIKRLLFICRYKETNNRFYKEKLPLDVFKYIYRILFPINILEQVD